MQVDAFTSEAFRGNPAAVIFVHEQALTSQQMQNIAVENNLSETAYLEHEQPGELADLNYFATASTFRLRCPPFKGICVHPQRALYTIPLLLPIKSGTCSIPDQEASSNMVMPVHGSFCAIDTHLFHAWASPCKMTHYVLFMSVQVVHPSC